MKIGILTGTFHPESGGPPTYLYHLLPELQQQGHEIRVLTYGELNTQDYGYPVTRVPRRQLPIRLMDYAFNTRSFVEWANLLYIHTLGLPILGRHRAPHIVKIVGDQAWERAVRKGWIPPTEDIDVFQTRRYGMIVNSQKAARSAEVRRMDGVIVPSEYLKRMVVGWRVPPENVQVIYNALPPDHVAPDLSQQEARTQLGLGTEPLLLTVARLTPWKGIDHLMAALRSLPDVKLLVAGDGDQLASLQQQAVASGLAARVTFLGKVSREKMPLYMKAADYLVLYSGYEGLSHTLLESLRAGTPVIASDKGGNPEVVRHGVNGLLVPYIDVDALAASLTEAFRPGERDRMAANTAVGMERFDFRNLVTQTLATLSHYGS